MRIRANSRNSCARQRPVGKFTDARFAIRQLRGKSCQDSTTRKRPFHCSGLIRRQHVEIATNPRTGESSSRTWISKRRPRSANRATPTSTASNLRSPESPRVPSATTVRSGSPRCLTTTPGLPLLCRGRIAKCPARAATNPGGQSKAKRFCFTSRLRKRARTATEPVQPGRVRV